MRYVMKILDNLERIENSLRDIYAGLAETMADDPEFHKLFVQLSREEETHAGQIRYQKRLVRQNPGDFSNVQVDLEGMDEVLQFFDHLLANPPKGTPEELLRLTIDMESISQERMYRSIISESCPALKPLIENLTRFDQDHLVRLHDFARQHFPGEFD